MALLSGLVKSFFAFEWINWKGAAPFRVDGCYIDLHGRAVKSGAWDVEFVHTNSQSFSICRIRKLNVRTPACGRAGPVFKRKCYCSLVSSYSEAASLTLPPAKDVRIEFDAVSGSCIV